MSRRGTAIAAAVVGFGGILIWAIPAPRPALQGWVVAVSAWAGIPLGSLVLVLVGELTGGRWRAALGPVLQPASRLTPVVVLALLPAFLDLGAVFPWVRSMTGVATDVRTLYLDPTLLAARTVVGLGGLAVLSLLPRGHASRLIAALGLAFAALALSVFSVDWMLSIEPGVTSSAYPATIIVQQVLTALGACAWVLSPVLGESDRADLAGLLMTALLGVLYLALMAFIVAWYGNLPDKAAWYLLRAEWGWLTLLLAGVGAGFIGPVLLLLSGRARRSGTALRATGAATLAGVALHTAWLMAPAFGWACMIPAALALLGLSGLSVLVGAGLASRREPVHA